MKRKDTLQQKLTDPPLFFTVKIVCCMQNKPTTNSTYHDVPKLECAPKVGSKQNRVFKINTNKQVVHCLV